jgi:hypothetical protein
VELLRMRRTDSQLALEYYQAAMSDPVAHGVTPEKCGDTLTWPAVEFAFGFSALAVLQSLGRMGDLDRLACGGFRIRIGPIDDELVHAAALPSLLAPRAIIFSSDSSRRSNRSAFVSRNFKLLGSGSGNLLAGVWFEM